MLYKFKYLRKNAVQVKLELYIFNMGDIDELVQALIKFRDERDWKQFHDSKNLAAAISIEAAELNQIFLWKTIKESEEVDKDKIKEELADILATWKI